MRGAYWAGSGGGGGRVDASYTGYVCCPTAGDAVRAAGRAADTARFEALGGGNGGSYALEVFGLNTDADGVVGAGGAGGVACAIGVYEWLAAV